jgi:soluble lytic murein transglycosylase
MRISRITAIPVLVWALLFMPSVLGAAINKDRQSFLQAHQALKKNNLETYKQLRTGLDSYPLTPYLDIWYTLKQLDKGNDSAVEETLLQHREIPEASNLHVAWMRNLAKRGQWPHITQHFNDFPRMASRLPEIAMVLRWRMGEQEEALKLFSKRWQQAKKISDFTQPMFQAWKKLGHPTTADRWQRIATYAKRGKWRKVKQLAKPLSKKEKGWINYWQSMQNNPAKALNRWQKDMPPRLARKILSDGLKRISRSDALAAWQALQKLDKTANAEIGEDAVFKMKRRIALRAAKQHVLVAASWLDELPESLKNEETRAWQARLYVLFHDWEKVQLAIAAMPVAEQRQSRWIYWRARVLEIFGNKRAALPLFAELAAGRGYYSFLSAEHLSVPIVFDVSEIRVPDAASKKLGQNPAIRRAYEWLQLGKISKANREWGMFFADASPEQWKVAAYLAASWNWHDRSIQAASRAGEKNALSSRFPMGFELQVRQASKQTDLEPAFIWSIIRQESAFNRQAVSRAGARGLMQLMPRTARGVIKKYKLKKGDIFSPEMNIRLGTLYLSEMTKRFGGNPALAAAAYNAGPHRVNTWLKHTPFGSAEAWIEAIPSNETRRYVQQVMAFVSVYEWRQAKIPGSLTARINKPHAGVKLSFNP